jgi:hypothetical protein
MDILTLLIGPDGRISTATFRAAFVWQMTGLVETWRK